MDADGASNGARPAFDEPSADRFLYAGWAVDPPARLPFVGRSDERARMVARCCEYAGGARTRTGTVSATVFETELMPPLRGAPRYDVLMLLRVSSQEELVRESAEVRDLAPDFMMSAWNSRRIGDTDRTSNASFLFNHFVAQRPDEAMAGFDQVAGWFPEKLGVDNTTLLQPDGQETVPYAFVNYVRVPSSASSFLLGMLIRPSFHTHVRKALRVRHMRALPLLAKPVRSEQLRGAG